jgi:hypothetical protein
MKTIHTIIESLKSVLGLNTLSKAPQLIAATQDNSCQNLAIRDYYCDENNLFI